MTPAESTQSLKQEAKRLGFSLAGACPAVTPSGYAHFLEWLDAGYAGEMTYLHDRQAAYQHPSGVLPGVRSLLMLAMDYRTKRPQQAGPGQGRIASYAWGTTDYHDVLHAKLKQLKRFAIELQPEMHVRGVVDTAPLLEREFAQLAGLGWIGKNTLLLNKTQGSFFFLAALLLEQELEYDQPAVTDHCGTCTACLDACPTKAFVQPYVLDATRCISYLTIEHRSPIDATLRPQMQDWVLGCDVCQDVCPWNRKPPLSADDIFDPQDSTNPLELRSLFHLDDETFRARFRKTPLWRPKRRGILRNAAVALGNRPDRGNLSALSKGLSDQEALVRGASAWALARHRFPEVFGVMRERIRVERDNDVMAELESGLAWLSAGSPDSRTENGS